MGSYASTKQSTRSEVELKKSERLPGENDILVRQGEVIHTKRERNTWHMKGV